MQQINFYQAQFRPVRTPLSSGTMLVLALVLVLGAAGHSLYEYQRLSPLKRQLGSVNSELENARATLRQVEIDYPAPQTNAALQAEHDLTQTRLQLTERIANKLRAGAYGSLEGLSGFLEGLARQHVDGTWVTAVQIAQGGRAVGIEGRALLPDLVPRYIGKLRAEENFSGLSFSDLNLAAAGGGLPEITFSLQTKNLAGASDE
ncbi:MAG: PilN domain-containing protein [Pseudomonadota bacterium]